MFYNAPLSLGIPGVFLPKSPLKEMFPFKAPEDACFEGERGGMGENISASSW